MKKIVGAVTLLGLLLLGSLVSPGVAQQRSIPYENERFGYRLQLPPAMLVVNRAADGSGVTWQTGTFRIQASGVNNPYAIKPHEYYSRIQVSAKGRIVEETQGYLDEVGYWHQILYTKDSRRIHQKTFIAGRAINILEVSYPYRLRKEKESVARRILDSFQPGDLLKLH